MICVLHGDGQMCNRIVYFATALAVAIEFKQDVTHFFADEILKFTDGHPEALPDIRVRLRDHRGSKLINYICSKLWRFDFFSRGYYERNDARIEQIRKSRWRLPLVLWNWCFRYNAGLVKHRERICAFLKAREEFVARPRQILAETRQGFSGLLVGVHMRRGDYKLFKNGSMYFSDEQYLVWMRQFEQSVRVPVRFVLVSNERIDEKFFRENGCWTINASGLPQEDVVTLSLCDYIMGPASTFSWWAAYYGNKPRLGIEHATDLADVRNFAPVNALITRFDG